MAAHKGNPALEIAPDGPVGWFVSELPPEPFAIKNKGMRMLTAESEEGFEVFVRTHSKAYGCRATKEIYEKYRLAVEEGVVDRDKMITLLQGGHPLGCMSYEVLEKPGGHKFILLHNLGVDLDHRGRGFGEEIIKIVLNMLVDDFGGGMTVLADVRSLEGAPSNILEKTGFKPAEPEEWFPA